MSKFNFGVLVLGSCLLAGARPAAAQSVMLPATGVVWSGPDDRQNLFSTQINAADCLGDAGISFSLTVTQPTPIYNLQVWAGTNCDVLQNRTDASLSNCWLLAAPPVDTMFPPPVHVRVRDLLYGRTLASSPNAGPDVPLAEACELQQPSSSAQSISLYFMLVDASESIQGTFATWTASYKLTPPNPPLIIGAQSGSDEIHVDFSVDQNDTTISGFQFYCEPGAGAAASGSDVAICSAPNAVLPGASANSVQNFSCGSAARDASTGNATGLANGVSYNVAATATDSYNNVSPLSNVVCQVPLASAVSTDDTASTDDPRTSRACSEGGRPAARGSRSAWAWVCALGCGTCLLRRRRARGRGRSGRRRLRRAEPRRVTIKNSPS
ncbi:MAG: hypothetical protein ABI548_09255 [Polyangiaceae bacterium]